MKINKIIRSNRKTIAFEISDDATLLIRAPWSITDEAIERIVIKNHKWINKKRKEVLSRDLSYSQKSFVNGEKFLYLGRVHSLKIVKNNDLDEDLILCGNYFFLKEAVLNREDVFLKWYKKAAYQVVLERAGKYSQQCGLVYNRVKISNAKKRWGSCSLSGNLNFSYRLIMAPLEVIDYVVIHELMHLLEKNHSKSFWSKVGMYMPDYKKHRNWLKRNGYLLRL